MTIPKDNYMQYDLQSVSSTSTGRKGYQGPFCWAAGAVEGILYDLPLKIAASKPVISHNIR